MSEKVRMVIVTKPEEVAIIELENATGALDLPRGGFLADGTCVAYAADLERWRAAKSPTASRADD